MRLILLATALSAALISYRLFWFRLAAEVPEGLDAWAGDMRARGWGVAYEAPAARGFPFRLEVELPNLMLARPRPGRGYAWKSELVTLHLQLWLRAHMLASFGGAQQLILDGVSWSGTADQAVVSLRRENGEVIRASLDVTGAQLAAAADGATFEAQRLQLHLRRHRQAESEEDVGSEPPQTDIYLQADEVTLPGQDAPPFTRQLPRFSLGLSHPTIAEGSLVWFEQGGPFEVEQLILNWPPIGASGNGRLSLDATGRPSGEFDVTIAGYGAIIEAMTRAGRLSDLEATMAQAVFAVLAAPQGNSGGIELAASLRDGGLYLGPLRLADLPILK